MKTISFPYRPHSRKRERGSAAVELALLIPVLAAFLTFPMFYARCFWQYTIVQKAAQDATRYLSTVSAAEMASSELSKAAANTALEIVRRETADLAAGSPVKSLNAYCNNLVCGDMPGGQLPATVRIYFTISMTDDIFGIIDTGRYGKLIVADTTMRYVGI